MSIQDVVESINSLHALHEQLLELTIRKKKVIIDNQVEELTRISNQEARLIKQVAEKDSHRLDAISRYLQQRGYRMNPSITVSDLIKVIFKAEEKAALTAAHDRLLNTLIKLKEINSQNHQLLEQSLEFIDFSLDLIIGPPDDEGFYQKPTQQNQGSTRKGIFDAKV